MMVRCMRYFLSLKRSRINVLYAKAVLTMIQNGSVKHGVVKALPIAVPIPANKMPAAIEATRATPHAPQDGTKKTATATATRLELKPHSPSVMPISPPTNAYDESILILDLRMSKQSRSCRL